MVDVLIIGAGPVGLTMAAQCLRYNISFRIIEKRSGPSKESRALAIHARTLELLQFLGVAKTFTKKGLPIKKALIYVDGDLKLNLDFTNLDSQYPYILSLEQSNTERILEKHLNKNGIKVERNKELISLSKSGTAIIKSRKRKEKVKPKYVIGCDGAHSTVRHKLKINFKGKRYEENLVLADLQVKGIQKKPAMALYANKDGIIGFFPLAHKGRFRFMATVPKDMEEAPLEMLQELANQRSYKKFKFSNPIWTSFFRVHKRVVPKMRYGNIFLLGDAAHIHSPAGGQGMNTGMHETANLAWKLKLVLTGNSENLLKTFNEERYPIVKKLLKGTDFATVIMFSENPVLLALKNFILPIVNLLKPVKNVLSKNMSELLINYEDSSIVNEDWVGLGGIKAGHRAPDVTINSKQLFDLLKNPKHCILVFGDVKKFKHFSDQANIYSLSSKAAKKYGIDKEGVYIIRPDGYIGYRSNKLNIEGCENYFSNLHFIF